MRSRLSLTSSGARYLLLGAALFLTFAGLVMVYSAAFVTDYVDTGDSAFTLKRQLAYIAAGFLLLYVFSRVDYHKLRRMAWPTVAIVDVALLAVALFGVSHAGARRVIDLGPVTLQPSEFAKIACILALAAVMSEGRARDEAQRLWRVVPILPPIIALVMLEPDMGTAMSILTAAFIVLWLGGLSWPKTLSLAGIAAAFTAVGIAVAPYRLERWLAFRDPWADPLGSGYQSIQAILAFASGGLTGVGLGMSRQKFSYLPEAHTDFILAIIGEELGLVGTLAVVVGFIAIAVAGFKIARSAKDPFGRLLAGGATALIVSQAAINMLAVTNLIPVTGIPLPFVSHGGNSILATLVCVGLIVSVSLHSREPAREVALRVRKGGERARTDQRRRDRRAHPPSTVGRGRTRIGRA